MAKASILKSIAKFPVKIFAGIFRPKKHPFYFIAVLIFILALLSFGLKGCGQGFGSGNGNGTSDSAEITAPIRKTPVPVSQIKEQEECGHTILLKDRKLFFDSEPVYAKTLHEKLNAVSAERKMQKVKIKKESNYRDKDEETVQNMKREFKGKIEFLD